MTKSKKVAIIALLTALSLISFILESLLPPLFIPGAKIGLANIFTMLCLIWFGLPEALITLAAKILLAAIFGGFSQVLYSAPAGLISLLVAFVFVRFLPNKISICAVCALSAVIHNLTQLAVFGMVTQASVIYYAPYLAIAGALAGTITGLAAFFVLKRREHIQKLNEKDVENA